MTKQDSSTAGGLSQVKIDRLGRWFRTFARHSPTDSGGVSRIGRRHIYILPTGAGFLLGAVLALMLLGSLNYQNNLALLFTFFTGSIAIVAMHHTWFNMLDLKVVAANAPPVFAGQHAVFKVTVANDRTRTRGDLRIHIGDRASAPRHLEGRDSGSVHIPVPTSRRGPLVPQTLRVETRYPLGLFRAWCYAHTSARVVVYPRPAGRSPSPLLAPVDGRCPQGDLGIGADDFVGLRDYRAGDSPRRLDWKALARERGLVVKQFGGDRAAQVWIDWDRLPSTDTETRLSLLCRQVLDAAENGLSYGLRLPGLDLPIGQGEIHKHRCLESLALFEHA